LQFPRSVTPYDVDYGVVPPDIIIAQYIMALLIDAGEDLTPVVEREIKLERLEGAVINEYMDNASSSSSYPQLDSILNKYIKVNGVVRV
jgi:hypothetical protein